MLSSAISLPLPLGSGQISCGKLVSGRSSSSFLLPPRHCSPPTPPEAASPATHICPLLLQPGLHKSYRIPYRGDSPRGRSCSLSLDEQNTTEEREGGDAIWG